jgi:hypothetical protein
MCGGCADTRARDEWSVALDSARARWEVAALVNRVLGRWGGAPTVVATPGGWMVRGGTGRHVLADTITQVLRASGAAARQVEAARAVLSDAGTPVAATVWDAYCSLSSVHVEEATYTRAP